MDWLDVYSNFSVLGLNPYGSDNVSLLLHLGTSHIASDIFRFDPEWLKNVEFVRLINK